MVRDASHPGQEPEESLKQGLGWSRQGATRGKVRTTGNGTTWVKAKKIRTAPPIWFCPDPVLPLKNPCLMPPDPASTET